MLIILKFTSDKIQNYNQVLKQSLQRVHSDPQDTNTKNDLQLSFPTSIQPFVKHELKGVLKY